MFFALLPHPLHPGSGGETGRRGRGGSKDGEGCVCGGGDFGIQTRRRPQGSASAPGPAGAPRNPPRALPNPPLPPPRPPPAVLGLLVKETRNLRITLLNPGAARRAGSRRRTGIEGKVWGGVWGGGLLPTRPTPPSHALAYADDMIRLGGGLRGDGAGLEDGTQNRFQKSGYSRSISIPIFYTLPQGVSQSQTGSLGLSQSPLLSSL